MVSDRTVRMIETLSEARNLIAAPNGWTQGTYARTEKDYVRGIIGRIMGVYLVTHSYCAVGAVEHVSGGGQSDALNSLVFAIEALHPQDIDDFWPCDNLTSEEKVISFNDSDWTDKRDVLAVFDYAINMAKLDLHLTRQMSREHEVAELV